VPILSQAQIEKYGITDPDLDQIISVTILGDKVVFTRLRDEEMTDLFSLGSRGINNGKPEWYSTENGQKIEMATYDDLDFLPHMPKLRNVRIGNAELVNMPDLKGNTQMSTIWVSDCKLENLEWVRETNITEFLFNSCGTLDFSPLTDCEKLHFAQLDFFGCKGADLSRFAPPELERLSLQNAQDIPQMKLDELNQCGKLYNLTIQGCPIRNLDFLQGMENLKTLKLENNDRLSDISAVGSLKKLVTLRIRHYGSRIDCSAIGGCTGLEEVNLELDWNYPITNADWIANMSYIRDISFMGCNFQNLDFLDSIQTDSPISFGFAGNVRDYSALGRRKQYGHMHLNPGSHDYSQLAPYLKDVEVEHLQLYDIRKVDLSQLPNVTGSLEIYNSNLENLHGLRKNSTIKQLKLQGMDRLKTLEGIENLPEFSERNGKFTLEVYGCPRLTDWSALQGKHLAALRLYGTYMVPDLGTFRTDNLALDYVNIEDLSCLEAIRTDSRINLEIYMPDEVNDLLPAQKLTGNEIRVTPQFREVAQSYVDDHHFNRIEIQYPDHSWMDMLHPFSLLSLDEIDTLPSSLLAKVESLYLAGDTVIDTEQYGVWQEWDWQANRNVWYFNEYGTEQRTEVRTGTLTDLSKISRLTGLKSLQILCQPLESLNGIDGMMKLEQVHIEDCDRLGDISRLFTLESLREIDIRNAPVQSIQGIQNLQRLTYLNLNNTNVTDILPLGECDLSFAEQQGGLSLTIQGNEPVQDLSPLDHIKTYGMMFMNERDAETWLPHMEGAHVRELHINTLRSDMLPTLNKIECENLQFDSFALASLEEIDSLPPEMLDRITEITIAGDQIVNRGRYELEDRWENNREVLYLRDKQNGEMTKVKMGKGLDLSYLAKLPKLENLTLQMQPITDLEALRPLTGLKLLSLRNCSKLKDISAISAMPDLERLILDNTAVTSLEGIQGHGKLLQLSLNNLKIKDMDLLTQCDFSYSAQNGGFGLDMAPQGIKDFSFLSAVPHYCWLSFGGNQKPTQWMEGLRNSQISGIFVGNMNQKELEQLLEQHPEIDNLHIQYNPKITDLTKLLSMPNLGYVKVSKNMSKAIQSIQGAEIRFQLDIEGQ